MTLRELAEWHAKQSYKDGMGKYDTETFVFHNEARVLLERVNAYVVMIGQYSQALANISKWEVDKHDHENTNSV
jgi:hypothetical protein